MIDHDKPPLEIFGEISNPVQGDSVHKIGQTTGWTYGVVTNTCVTFARDFSDYSSSYGQVILSCQDLADYGRNSGDSGAPVFIFPEGETDYELVRTEGTTEWRFHGTLTITTVDEAVEVQGTWDVTSAGGDSRYADTITSGHWDLDAYVIGATVVGDPGWEIQNRIAGVDGEVKCRIARIGAEAAACILHGPR